MTERHVVKLTAATLEKALQGVRAAAKRDGWFLELRQGRRTDEQNDALHGLIDQIIKQRPVHFGVRADKETYKAIFMHALGREMRLFDDPAQYFGHLNDELLRATRLVVDTGMHAKGWTREQTIQYMKDTLGYDAVANYSVAYRILETVLFVTFSVNQAIFPVMSATTSLERIRRGYERALAVIGFVYLPFATVCVLEGGKVIRLLFGERYADSAAPILQLLAPAPLFYAVAFFGSSVLLSRRLQAATLVAAAVATLVNVVANVALIPRWEGVGAAVATSLSYAVQAAAMLVAVRGRAGVRVGVLRPLLESGLASALLAVVLWLVEAHLVVELATGGVVYLGVWTLISRVTAPEQLEVISTLLLRRRRRGADEGAEG